jgi:hypothetical protein
MEPENFRVRTKEVTDDAKYNFPNDLPLRPGKNTTGKAIQIRVNQYKVTGWQTKDIFQYDVSFTFAFIINHFKLTNYTDQHWKWCREERQDHGCLDVPQCARAPSSKQPAQLYVVGWQQASLVFSRSLFNLIIL